MNREVFRIAALTLAMMVGCHCGWTQSEDAAVARYSGDGQRALAAHNYEAAETNFLALAKLEPEVAEVHATLGLIYFQEKKFNPAVNEIRQAQKLKPGLARLDSLLAMSLSETGNYSEALPGLEKAFKQSADPAVKRMCGLQLLRAYTALHSDEKAVEVALRLNQEYPKDAEVLYNTGKIYGNYAFLTIQKLATDAPNSVWRHLASAEAYESQGAANDALGEYKQVLVMDPRRAGVHYRMGRTLLAQFHRTGDHANVDQARAEFEQELQVDPGNGNAAYEIGEMHRQAGELDKAEQYFQEALQHYPNFAEAQSGLAAVYMAEKKPEQAEAPLKAALAMNANDEVTWYRLSQVERALGKRPEQQDALAHFQKLHQAALVQNATGMTAAGSDVTKQEVVPGEN